MSEHDARNRARDDERGSSGQGELGMPSREIERKGTLAVELEPWRWTLVLEVLHRVGVEADARGAASESVITDLFVTHALLSKQLGSVPGGEPPDE